MLFVLFVLLVLLIILSMYLGYLLTKKFMVDNKDDDIKTKSISVSKEYIKLIMDENINDDIIHALSIIYQIPQDALRITNKELQKYKHIKKLKFYRTKIDKFNKRKYYIQLKNIDDSDDNRIITTNTIIKIGKIKDVVYGYS